MDWTRPDGTQRDKTVRAGEPRKDSQDMAARTELYLLTEKSKVHFQSSFITDGPPEFISPTMGTDNIQGLFRPIQRTESTEVTGLKTTCPALGCLLHVFGQDVMPTVMNMFQGRRVPMPSQRKMTYTMRQGSWGPGLPPAFVSSPIFTSF